MYAHPGLNPTLNPFQSLFVDWLREQGEHSCAEGGFVLGQGYWEGKGDPSASSVLL